MSITCLQGMLTIETFFDSNKQPKLLLEQDVIKNLNIQISKELQSIIPNLDDSSYAIVGALFQSSEILQPGFPIHSQLRQYANAALKGENNRRNQLIIGANDNKLPKGLKRNSNVQITPLLLMPFVIITENQETKDVFEKQLMHKGMGSVDLLKQMQIALGIKIRHINFMSMLDLAAMMHNHLQMAGFEPLWNILEQSLFNDNPETKAVTRQHNEFYLSKKIVFTPFFSYKVWTSYGPGKDLANKEESYLHYTQVQRQHVATLKEHGIDIRQFVPTPEIWPTNPDHICFATLDNSRIDSDYYHEVLSPLS
ncbi:MAG: hypothetical protein AB8B80_05100, partial [Marinicellaceae bacterium]